MFWRIFYYVLAQHLPDNYLPIVGKIFRATRNLCCRKFCTKVSKSANIQKHVYIGSGIYFEIGNHSGLDAYSKIQSCKLKIGNDVMIGEHLYIIGGGHIFEDKNVPMRLQGNLPKSSLEICDDVWIGAHVIITKGCSKIGRGSVIGAGSVVTHDVEEYSVVAGNPARILRKR